MTKDDLSMPVKPMGMDINFYYSCPSCHTILPLGVPTQAATVSCPLCRHSFPIMPVDERTIAFFRLMTDEGKALVKEEC